MPGDTEGSSLCAVQEARSVVFDGIFRGKVTIEYHQQISGNTPEDSRAVWGTSSDTFDISVSASVSIDPSKPEIQVVGSNKNANYSHLKTGSVFIPSNCTQQIFSTSETGSSLSLLPQESMFLLRFIDQNYYFSTVNPVGPTLTTGTISEKPFGACTFDSTTRQINLVNARQSYLPERIFGTGTVITNASDGSKTISGTSTKNETLQSSPGVSQTTNYTMTWNLTAF